MSQIKLYILSAFFVCILQVDAQSNFENDNSLQKNSIQVKLNNADNDASLGDYYNALIYLKSALKIADDIDAKQELGIINSKIASLYYQMKELDSADVYINRAIEIQTIEEDSINLAITRFTNGLLYLEREQYIQALDLFTNASEDFEVQALEDYMAKVALYEGITYFKLKNYIKASLFFDKVILL